jgi:hypothetical protein
MLGHDAWTLLVTNSTDQGFEPSGERNGTRGIRGERHIVHVTDAHQGADIGFMRLSGQWITEEKYGQHVAFSDLRSDLLIATQWTGKHAGDLEAGEFGKDRTGGAGGNQGEMTQNIAVIERKTCQIVFFLVMCDQRDQAHAGIHASNIAEEV